jgi:hypothetical protein
MELLAMGRIYCKSKVNQEVLLLSKIKRDRLLTI